MPQVILLICVSSDQIKHTITGVTYSTHNPNFSLLSSSVSCCWCGTQRRFFKLMQFATKLRLCHVLLSSSTRTFCHWIGTRSVSPSLLVSVDLTEEKKTASPSWQVETDGNKNGIIRKSDGGVQAFEYKRKASFGENHSLLLPNVNESDAGMYSCDLSANVGGQNKEEKVELTGKFLILFFKTGYSIY